MGNCPIDWNIDIQAQLLNIICDRCHSPYPLAGRRIVELRKKSLKCAGAPSEVIRFACICICICTFACISPNPELCVGVCGGVIDPSDQDWIGSVRRWWWKRGEIFCWAASTHDSAIFDYWCSWEGGIAFWLLSWVRSPKGLFKSRYITKIYVMSMLNCECFLKWWDLKMRRRGVKLLSCNLYGVKGEDAECWGDEKGLRKRVSSSAWFILNIICYMLLYVVKRK